MSYPLLKHYVNQETGSEYVVVATEDGSPNDWEVEGYALLSEAEIDGDIGPMPVDQPLIAVYHASGSWRE